MLKMKLFHGEFNRQNSADDKFNEWIKQHPKIILNPEWICYQEGNCGYHSILVTYIDKEEVKTE